MTPAEWAAWAQALAGLATFGAACVAVKAAYDAPKRAAQFAENLRQNAVREDEIVRQKRWILATLLQHRANFEYVEPVNALNAITIVFVDDQEVRDAYTHFLAAAGRKGLEFQDAAVKERYLAIIEKIVRNLGMNSKITVAEIHEGYYPNFLVKQRMLFSKEINEKFDEAFPGLHDRVMKGEAP